MLSNPRRSLVGAIFISLCLVTSSLQTLHSADFLRGDVDSNGSIEVTDSVIVLSELFLEPQGLTCRDAADVNDSGKIDIADGIYGLNFLFVGGTAPPSPFPTCGEDPTADPIACERQDACEPVSTLTLSLTTGGGFTGRGIGDFELTDGRFTVRRPFGNTDECAAELTDAQEDRLLDAAHLVDWESVETNYVPPDNPQCCCDQISSKLDVVLLIGALRIQRSTSWCDQSMDEGIVPQDLVRFIEAVRSVASQVEKRCEPD